jgi:hypothetical protein
MYFSGVRNVIPVRSIGNTFFPNTYILNRYDFFRAIKILCMQSHSKIKNLPVLVIKSAILIKLQLNGNLYKRKGAKCSKIGKTRVRRTGPTSPSFGCRNSCCFSSRLRRPSVLLWFLGPLSLSFFLSLSLSLTLSLSLSLLLFLCTQAL